MEIEISPRLLSTGRGVPKREFLGKRIIVKVVLEGKKGGEREKKWGLFVLEIGA